MNHKYSLHNSFHINDWLFPFIFRSGIIIDVCRLKIHCDVYAVCRFPCGTYRRSENNKYRYINYFVHSSNIVHQSKQGNKFAFYRRNRRIIYWRINASSVVFSARTYTRLDDDGFDERPQCPDPIVFRLLAFVEISHFLIFLVRSPREPDGSVIFLTFQERVWMAKLERLVLRFNQKMGHISDLILMQLHLPAFCSYQSKRIYRFFHCTNSQ